ILLLVIYYALKDDWLHHQIPINKSLRLLLNLLLFKPYPQNIFTPFHKAFRNLQQILFQVHA
ncbi:MAG: hypothetical protein ACKO96_00465, partial [Flammeovirgaceae bacterium]